MPRLNRLNHKIGDDESSIMTESVFCNTPVLPVEIVLAPAWWFHNEGLTFDEDFFFHPAKRVESEQKMEKALYERWGKFGLGIDKDKSLPAVGAVHLAAGFMLSEMLGCKVEYKQDAPPQVICSRRPALQLSASEAFDSPVYKKFEKLTGALKRQFGYLAGDVNWGGILNVGLDVRGENLFMDMFDRPDGVHRFLGEIAAVIERFTEDMFRHTGSTSISVNRTVRHFSSPIFLHSTCSHTMISAADYEKFLFKYDAGWSKKYRPFGIHFCGGDAHRFAGAFAKLPYLDFLDVGWGSDVSALRKRLPNTFLNIRLSPVEIIDNTRLEIEQTIRRLVRDSANPRLTGVCCINMDEKAADEKITTIFETVEELRKNALAKR
ncbi:MAG TPA: uroporphyrinogen decarboxylase family protein [Sedimentisphaerales bacterium]|nr:uroporphyrinogen decarboxylase family protein [Sedimentisphaerales bacterium]